MPSPAYMSIYDDAGSQVNGPVSISDRKNTVEILSFNHKVYIPTDKDTGTLTSTRKHNAFEITKAFGPTSPVLYKACCDGKTLNKIVLDWYEIDNNGKEKKRFTHTLEGVKVVAIEPVLPHIKDMANDLQIAQEKVSFRYKKINWKFHDGNIESSDTWTERS